MPSDPELDAVITQLCNISIAESLQTLPKNSPPLPLTPHKDRQRHYIYSSPTKSRETNAWDEAAHTTQGVSCGRATRVTKSKISRSKKNAAYAVFYGQVPGTYQNWSPEIETKVAGARHTLYCGYSSIAAAKAAFEYAEICSWTRVCTSRSPSPSAPPSEAMPLPVQESEPSNPLHEDVPGSKWYIVYAGIKPGVYQSSLECGLNTRGIRCSVYDSTPSKEEAFSGFATAFSAGRTRILECN
ncbi:hypothetical protein C8J57DRAFT_1246521 [Mycena rebaudengoi]|nr:hypothetical protein C8J57DRAFT_1246521 [Mycena rebaudengoi]